MNTKRIGQIIIMALMLAVQPLLYAQDKEITLSGKVFNNATKQPVEFGTVIIVEAKKKARTETDGSYVITIPEAGTYTVLVQSSQLKNLETTIEINKDVTKDFYLEALRIRGTGLTITADRDIQKLSRQTMDRKKLKEVPGTMGDSLGAISSLPGIVRTDNLFGPLVIRGANFISNNYFIDDILIMSPLHFDGMYCVINNNLINEIDVYASAFPASFGSATSAVIDITTVDDVKEFGGYADANILMTNLLVQAPILRDTNGDLSFTPPLDSSGNTENAGYAIVAGRYSYFSLFMKPIQEELRDEGIEVVPEFWDYQAKFKYYINRTNSITLLFIGSNDYILFKKKRTIDPDEDPYFARLEFKSDSMFNSQGIYYTYEPSKRFRVKLIGFSSLNYVHGYFDIPVAGVAEWIRNLYIDSRPYIFGGKAKTKYEWWPDKSVLNTSIEYSRYYFTMDGKTAIPRGYISVFDITDPDAMLSYRYDEKIVNHTIGGYAENKFTFGNLELVPGIRSDYLKGSKNATLDPRGLVSYEFPTGTTLALAGGRYSYFYQTNPQVFIDKNPDITKKRNKLKPEKAIHRVAGIEQKLDLFTFRVEGFNNYFYDMLELYPHVDSDGTFLHGLNSGKLKAKGAEFMISKDRREGEDGLFGWVSYTYTRSKNKTGLPTADGLYGLVDGNGDYINEAGDEYGDRWLASDFEQKHAMKCVAGYVFGNHTLSSKFQLYSSFPYTPIVGSIRDPFYTAGDRYIPIYGERNTKHFSIRHSLDIRYSYKKNFTWGYVSFYVEVLNVYSQQPEDEESWDSRYPYGPNNPRKVSSEKEDDDTNVKSGMMPNFGVEIKF